MSGRMMVVVALTLVIPCGCSSPSPPEAQAMNDLQTAKALIGAWSGEEEGNGVTFKAVTRFKTDGTFEGEATPAQASDKAAKATMSGTWMVEDGFLIETFEKSSQPRWIKPRQVRKDQVLSIDEKELKYKTEKGREGVRSRAS